MVSPMATHLLTLKSACSSPLASNTSLSFPPTFSDSPPFRALASSFCRCNNGNDTHYKYKGCVITEAFNINPLWRQKADHRLICRAAEYKFPDPIPEFAEVETEKFRNHLLKKLPKKDIFGDSVEEVVGICTEIFSTFLHTEYGGPGTLLVIPFIDMADTLNEQGLTGGPQAARVAIKWAQNHVDKDWKEWTSKKNVSAI